MTQRWRTLVLLYPVLDARYGSGLQRGRARRVMTRDERAAVMDVVERLPATVEAWSDGLASLEPFDVVEVRRSIRLAVIERRRSMVGRAARGPAGARGRRRDGRRLRLGVRAVAVRARKCRSAAGAARSGPSEATFGAGFSSISTDHWRTLLTDPDPGTGIRPRVAPPGRGGVPGARRGGGRAAAAPRCRRLHLGPAPADEAPFGRTFAEYHDGGARTWAPWYRDWMTGRLVPARDGEVRSLADTYPIGLTPARWELRGRPR